MIVFGRSDLTLLGDEEMSFEQWWSILTDDSHMGHLDDGIKWLAGDAWERGKQEERAEREKEKQGP